MNRPGFDAHLLFGQNVPYPGFGEDSKFIASVAIMLIIAGTLFLVFKRKNWL